MRVLLAILITAQFATARSYIEPYPLCASIQKVQVLFIGTPIAPTDTHTQSNHAPHQRIVGIIRYHFKVEEMFKGLDPGVHEVLVDTRINSVCSEPFVPGRRYLISGDGLYSDADLMVMGAGGTASGEKSRPVSNTVTGVCSGMSPVEKSQEDIAFARQYFMSPQPAKIFGSVRSYVTQAESETDGPPLNDANISIIGPKDTKSTIHSAADGSFQLNNIEPGTYELIAKLEGYRPRHGGLMVEVPPHGCGVARIEMLDDAGISGRVIKQDGSPAAGVSVEYLPAGLKSQRTWGNYTSTDEEGNFEFTGMSGGDFLLGSFVSNPLDTDARVPPTYWPGVTDSAKAEVIHLGPNEHKKNLAIQLGTPKALRTIQVQVVLPNGHPVPNAVVSDSAGSLAARQNNTDQNGMIDLIGLEGVEYNLDAVVLLANLDVTQPKGWFAAQEKLSAGSGPVKVKLVLEPIQE